MLGHHYLNTWVQKRAKLSPQRSAVVLGFRKESDLLAIPGSLVCGGLVQKLSPLKSALMKGAAQPEGSKLGPF